MSYTESQQLFYQQFPAFLMGLFAGLILLVILNKLFSNKRFVRVFCRFVLLIPALLVIAILHITKYHS